MGKRNKKGKSRDCGKATDFPAKVQRETAEIVKQLLEKCTVPGGSSRDWDRHVEIYGLVTRLIELQAGHTLKREGRDGCLSTFNEWLASHGVRSETVAVGDSDHGLGLLAQDNIKEHDLILKIPRKLIMSTETARQSVLGDLIREDRILQSMPNVVLALHLLCEMHNPDSVWKPYLHVLPQTYSTPLYFTLEEMKLLKGSPAFEEVLNNFRSIARQYAYFYKLLNDDGGCGCCAKDTKTLPLLPFCFDDYRWAVSTVMTRQNKVPGVSGAQMETGFIPLYDMANHATGELTTDFSLEENSLKCFAMRNFSQGEQVFIFYGQRSNAEFLLHNGFIYPQNECDRVNVKLGISKNDPLYSMKAELLARVSLLPSRLFSFHKLEDPVDSETLAYLRIFNMDQGELQTYLTGERSKQTSSLRDFSELVSVQNERKVWKFLETRAQLLVKSYPRTLQEEGALLQSGSLSPHAHLCVQLTFQEKKLLENTLRYAQENGIKLEMEVQRLNMGAVSVTDGAIDDGHEGVANQAQENNVGGVKENGLANQNKGDIKGGAIDEGIIVEKVKITEVKVEEPVGNDNTRQEELETDVDLDMVKCL